MPQGPMDLNAAIAPGLAGANSVDQAITQALAFWNNITANTYNQMQASALDDNSVQAAAAIALLTAEQSRIRNPAQ